jgi:hypothetical protein
MQDVSASTNGLQACSAVRVLHLEHATVTGLPPNLAKLEMVRCRVTIPMVAPGKTLESLVIDSCTGQVSGKPHRRIAVLR